MTDRILELFETFRYESPIYLRPNLLMPAMTWAVLVEPDPD